MMSFLVRVSVAGGGGQSHPFCARKLSLEPMGAKVAAWKPIPRHSALIGTSAPHTVTSEELI